MGQVNRGSLRIAGQRGDVVGDGLDLDQRGADVDDAQVLADDLQRGEVEHPALAAQQAPGAQAQGVRLVGLGSVVALPLDASDGVEVSGDFPCATAFAVPWALTALTISVQIVVSQSR